jgi:hypothetical protein
MLAPNCLSAVTEILCGSPLQKLSGMHEFREIWFSSSRILLTDVSKVLAVLPYCLTKVGEIRSVRKTATEPSEICNSRCSDSHTSVSYIFRLIWKKG